MNSERYSPNREEFPSPVVPMKAKLILYISQIVAIFIVIIAAVVNLSIGNSNKLMWASLLSSTLGYVLPNPKLPSKQFPAIVKKKRSVIESRSPDQERQIVTQDQIPQ